MGDEHVPLSVAALELRKTYHRVRELVMLGDLPGGRDEHGHWYVERAALDRAKRDAAVDQSVAVG